MRRIVSTNRFRHAGDSGLAAAGAVLLHGLALWLVFKHKTDAPIEAPRIFEVSLLAAPAPPAPAPPAPPAATRAESVPKVAPKWPKQSRPLTPKRSITPPTPAD
jgi:hypothetical protein